MAHTGAVIFARRITAAIVPPRHRQVDAGAGMEMTDEVHWSDVHGRNGTLTTYEMGDKRSGKWWVRHDELCQDRGKGLKACYEVWMSGKKVELRGGGSTVPLEGVLGTPIQHR